MSRLRIVVSAAAAAGMSCLALPLGVSGVQAHDRPPETARPGECYGKVTLPPVYGTARNDVIDQPGWTETRRAASVVQRIGRRVLVRPATVERFRTAPVWRTEVSWIVHRGAVKRIHEPAEYEIVREKVEVEPGHAEWRRADAPLAYGETAGRTLVQGTGEVVCRVWVPARYKTIEREQLVSAGRSYTVQGPSWREKVVRKVQVGAGGWVERVRPAVYRTVYEGRVVRPGRAEVISHPPTYRSVEAPTVIRPERDGWARVVCGGAINPAFMARVQQALIAQGFDPGAPTGAGTPQTYAALRQFQRQHSLAQGQLTEETARALGVM